MNATGSGLPLSTHPVKLNAPPPQVVVYQPEDPPPAVPQSPSSVDNQSQWSEGASSSADEEEAAKDGRGSSWNDEGRALPPSHTVGPLCGRPSKYPPPYTIV